MQYREDNQNRAFADEYNQLNSVVTSSIDLNVTILDGGLRSLWPGETQMFSLQALDEFGNPTGALSRFYFYSINEVVFL